MTATRASTFPPDPNAPVPPARLLGSRPLDYEQRPEPRSCVGCGEPIQPGQLYLVNGPLHFGCGRR